MPNVTGIELVIRARELYPGLPFIITSADLENYQEEFENEKIPYLKKPYNFNDLKEKIEENISPL
jgi:two-component SAPR family response regulator